MASAWGIGVGLQGSGNLVLEPGPFFLISTTITLVGGTMFLLWLGEQITSRGIGNGTSMIIFAGIIAETAFTPSPELRLIPLEDPSPIRTPGLLWKKGVNRSPTVKHMASVIRRAASGHAG